MARDPVTELEEPAEKQAMRLEKLVPKQSEIEAAPFEYSRLRAFRNALAEFDVEVTYYADDIVIAIPRDDPMHFMPIARILKQMLGESVSFERVDY